MIFDLYSGTATLKAQLGEAERSLAQKQRLIVEQLSALDTTVRRRVTAPDVLLWSLGTGFAVGELTKKRAASHAEAPPEHSEAPSARPGHLRMLLHYWTIAQPIIAGAAGYLAPYLHRMREHTQHQEAPAPDAVHVNTSGEPAPPPQSR